MNRKKKNIKPPKLFSLLFKFFFPDSGKYTTLGDLHESFFFIAKKEGSFKAKWWYRKEVFVSVYFILNHLIQWSVDMFRNYIKLAWRNLIKHKTHSVINLSGLTLGIAVSIIILLFTIDELGFDKFHKNYDKTARLVIEEFVENGDNQFYPRATAMAGNALKENYPEVINYVNIMDNNILGPAAFSYEETQIIETDYIFTTHEFFDIFDFELIIGNGKEILSQPNQLIITETAAKKYFGEEDPIGKTLSWNNWATYNVSAVLEDMPGNSSFDM